jgi:hypothetical protein
MSDAAARRVAAKILDLTVKLKELSDEKAQLEDSLREYVEVTENTEIGPLMAYKRASAPKLVGATGKKMDALTAQLISELDDLYVRKILDVKSISEQLDTDRKLVQALRLKGLSIEQTEKYYFKHIS